MKRFIEASFPVTEVSAESANEKNILSSLHIWWARRPLVASRATAYAALIPPPKDTEDWNRKRNFISNLSKRKNSLNSHLIETARKEILEANDGEPPKVLDPFGGGGSIPLEELRLGCETYSNDLNPVAVLIQKCTLEYPQRYGNLTRLTRKEGKGGATEETLFGETAKNPLVEDVKKWSAWVLAEAKKELEKYYPEEEGGSIPVGWIWARTIPCQNPSCGAEIPLMRQFWLAIKPKKKVALYPFDEAGEVSFKIVGDGYELMPDDFNTSNGTVSRAVAVCSLCGGTVEAKLTRKLFQEGKAGQQMVAFFTYKTGMKGKRYRVATDADLAVFREAEAYLVKKREQFTLKWGMDAVPDEPLPPKGTLGFRVQGYGILKWGGLFNPRQKLALITFAEKVKAAYQKMIAEGCDGEYTKAVVGYLALGVDMTIAFSNTLARWENRSEAIKQLCSRQALSMLWDYIEVNPFSGSTGSFETGCEYYLKVIKYCSQSSSVSADVTQSSAANLQHPANFFDAVFTDPPYYDNVPYSYLSDFFFVWLKRTAGRCSFPELFSTPLTPKKNEIVAYSRGRGRFGGGKTAL